MGTARSSFARRLLATHWLRVVAGNSVIHEEMVNISGPGQTLSVSLKDQSSANRSAGSTYLDAATNT